MEKKVLIAVFLSFLVLYAWQAIFPPPKPVKKDAGTTATAAATTTVPAAASTPAAQAAGPAVTSPEPPGTVAAAAAQPGAAPEVGELAERPIVVETSTVSATFSNRGGVATSWR